MPDLFHFWGEDLSSSPGGDLAIVLPLNVQNVSTLNGDDEGTQRIYRRLMTRAMQGQEQSGENIFDPGYGAGLPQKIGERVDVPGYEALVSRQIYLEDAVAQSPSASVNVTATPTGYVYCEIDYTNAQTGQPVNLSFDPTPGVS